MKSSRLKKVKTKIEDNIIKDVTNLFKLKKVNETTIKDVRNLFRLKNK